MGLVDAAVGPSALAREPGLLESLRTVVASTSPRGIAWMARAIADRADTSDVLGDLAVPVLLLFGDEDEATPPARGHEMRALRAAQPAYTGLEVLTATGHLTGLERPAEVATLLDRFVTEQVVRPA